MNKYFREILKKRWKNSMKFRGNAKNLEQFHGNFGNV